jgi:hypothetical protein
MHGQAEPQTAQVVVIGVFVQDPGGHGAQPHQLGREVVGSACSLGSAAVVGIHPPHLVGCASRVGHGVGPVTVGAPQPTEEGRRPMA